MSIGPDQQRLNPTERANLIAYLDGELGEADTQAIATKLTRSVSARREIEQLQKTWELLDHLPRPQASDALTHRTLTEVGRIEGAGDRLTSVATRTARRALMVGFQALVATALFLVGLALTRWAWPNPSARLARDLSVAEHLDEYLDVGTIEFLEALDRSPEFGNEAK